MKVGDRRSDAIRHIRRSSSRILSEKIIVTRETGSSVLPKTLYVVYGLESSGTTFVAQTLGTAIGVDIHRAFDRNALETFDKQTHIQHISLPTGSFSKDLSSDHWGYDKGSLPIEPVMYPRRCQVEPNDDVLNESPELADVPAKCQSILGLKMKPPPHRYFVNIKSHVKWYQERGVTVYPILVVRDPSFHFHGILKSHCTNATVAYEQYEQGKKIISESYEVDPIIVSYEGLMTMQQDYLFHLYRQMNIESSYVPPKFQNGNLKYLPKGSLPHVIEEKLKE